MRLLPRLRPAVVASLMLLLVPFCGSLQAEDGKSDFSAAERLLFMDDQLGNVTAPATLGYRFHKGGSLEPGFDDQVALALSAGADKRCCATHTDFLSGNRRLSLPDLPAAQGNPVILHFLEREVREMQRLTRGSQTHFRKRLRMAIYEGAQVQPVVLRFEGREVKGQQVRITPYLDDPNRFRYERLAQKAYVFLLSTSVPGGLYGIQTRIAAGDGRAIPLLVETLYIDGAEPALNETEKR
jgi:hypothetical protein